MEKGPCTDSLAQVPSRGRVASCLWRAQCRQARRRSRRDLPPQGQPPGMPPYLPQSEGALPDPKEASSSWPCAFSYSKEKDVLVPSLDEVDPISRAMIDS